MSTGGARHVGVLVVIGLLFAGLGLTARPAIADVLTGDMWRGWVAIEAASGKPLGGNLGFHNRVVVRSADGDLASNAARWSQYEFQEHRQRLSEGSPCLAYASIEGQGAGAATLSMVQNTPDGQRPEIAAGSGPFAGYESVWAANPN